MHQCHLVFGLSPILINCKPTFVLNLHSPFDKIFNKPPNYHKLGVFGCLCHPWLCPYTSHKLEPCSHPCVFVGYSNEYNAYSCLDPKTNLHLSPCRIYRVCLPLQELFFSYPFCSRPSLKSMAYFNFLSSQC